MRNLCLSLLIGISTYTAAAFAQTSIETFPSASPLAEEIMPAEEIVPAAAIPIPMEADTQTRLWLLRQESGAMAGNRYNLPGQAATLVYQRYLKSFSHPIPAELGSASGDGASGSSSGR